MAPSELEEGAMGRTARPSTVEVLLVDDDETWARTQRRVLERYAETTRVSTAHTLRTARAALEPAWPDCIVCDYQLGDGTGLELLEAVRNERPDVPFVLVTGQGDESVASDAIGASVTDYVRKDDVASQPELLAMRVESVVNAYRTERELERERHNKEALLGLVTASTTRHELARSVCRHLVDEHWYECAWVGVLDRDGALVPLSAAGATEYLEAALEPGTKPGDGTEPALAALARDELFVVDQIDQIDTVVDDGAEDEEATLEPCRSDTKPWRKAAHECGLQSAMAAPIRHDGVRFGVLAVYGIACEEVTQRKIDLLSEYADAIGYALQAAEWRRTLLSSTNTTVEITIEGGSSTLRAFSRALPRAATIELTTVLPRNDTEVFYLASISGASVGEIEDASASVASIRSVDVFGAGDPVQCGLIVETPVPETILVESGGRFRRTVVEDGRVSISADIRADGSVRSVVDALEDVFGGVSVTTVWSDATGRPNIDYRGLERLTDRQRQVFELAVDAGYFERPRRHNTSELAAMLDISRATFTQHLRAAQSKLFDDLLSN